MIYIYIYLSIYVYIYIYRVCVCVRVLLGSISPAVAYVFPTYPWPFFWHTLWPPAVAEPLT